MNIENKTALITGGGSGIGLAIATAFAAKGARIILTGRNEAKLKDAVATLSNASYIVADVANATDVARLVQRVKELYGKLDILVNNAGISNGQLPDSATIYELGKEEMDINFLSILRLNQLFLPLLKESGDAAIVNIQSVLSYVPSLISVTYSATKAALHSYSQSLRLFLEQQGHAIKVFEVFPPLTETAMAKRIDAAKLTPEEIGNDVAAGVESDTFAIRSGITKDVYKAVLQSPETALLAINGMLDAKAAS
ncbi:SDR family NAD(P)-dependent oxidoreductase [Chitinophaga agrisoli]|uniref:SDR family NAD(P)-dependent oxidoreductase n=1 Tax=Chitinophaga agrisoli TaxID=2607653 RepID=A0A5B2VIB5_9BACT|nr:SDR family NAD(P)-dependent oxidoreductase [Chitinophaga agrisoli]KAA2239323.1 SDR family NAD(P)-dependent oxidoreductase [Chitinophaga agrisoli]